jgi:hypothetical protein
VIRKSAVGLLLTAYCLLFSVFAQEIPVNIKADSLKFYEGTGLVEAAGSVEVRFEEATIYADRLKMDSATNIATAEGNVRLVAKEYDARSRTLIYDADTQTSRFSDFNVSLSPKNVRGKVYLSARDLSDDKNKMYGGPGSLTTCGEPTPHYFALANRVDYYPEDRVEARNATLFVGELPVFWMPYFYYDLKEQRRRNWSFGHNEVEGDFVKSTWLMGGGLLFLDLMSKKGIGYGTQQNYGLGALGLGEIYLYHVDEQDNGRPTWIEKINHQKQITPATALKLNHSYMTTYRIPSGRIDQTALGLELNYNEKPSSGSLKFDTIDDRAGFYSRYGLQFNLNTEKSSTSYYSNYEFAKNDPRWLRASQRFYLRRSFSERFNFSTTTNYYHSTAKEGDIGEERVEPQIEFTGAEKDFSWRYSQNWFVDLRQYLSPGVPRYEFLERQPEIEIYPKTLDLKFFTLQSTLGFGRYREVKYVPDLLGKRDFTTERYRTTLNASKSIPLGLTTVLALGAGVDQFLYTPGDQLYALRESAGLTTNLRECFRNEINFRQGYTAGNTPFFFDQLGTRYHDIREKMTFYYLDKFSWSTDGGHNWQANKYYDVMTHLMVQPDKRVRWTVDTGWDIENTKWKDLVSALRWAPASFFAASLALTKDMNLGELRSASALYDIYFLEGAPNQLFLRFSQVYDPATKEFRVRDIMAVKDLHCWEIKYTYSDYRKEFSLVFSLKALPGEPVGFATGRGFYYEGFEKQMKEFTPAGEVRRY